MNALLAALRNRKTARDQAAATEARAWLVEMRPTTHPYDNPTKPTWWGGPDLGIEADLAYEDEKDDA